MRSALWILAISAALTTGLMQRAHAQDIAYVVSYFEAAPAAKDQAATLARQFGEQSRKDDGNLRFEVLQRLNPSNHFAIVEAWRDAKAQAAHAAAPHTKEFRDKLNALLRSPYDERPHTGLSVDGLPAAGATRDTIYVVTHVDFIPPEKDNGIAMIKSLSDASRKDAGNQRFEALQQNSRPNHTTLFEAWKDQQSVDAHGVMPHTKQFREKLTPISGALFDERLYKSIN